MTIRGDMEAIIESNVMHAEQGNAEVIVREIFDWFGSADVICALTKGTPTEPGLCRDELCAFFRAVDILRERCVRGL